MTAGGKAPYCANNKLYISLPVHLCNSDPCKSGTYCSSLLSRSKSGSDYGDRDEDGPAEKPSTPRKMEPAPPPKENAWVQRSRQNQSHHNDEPAVSISLSYMACAAGL